MDKLKYLSVIFCFADAGGSSIYNVKTAWMTYLGLHIEEKEDSLSTDSLQSIIKAMSCDQTYQSICITKHGMLITKEKYNFFHAKLHCENNLGRLIIQNDTIPRDIQSTLYWIGTFRQSIVEQTSTVKIKKIHVSILQGLKKRKLTVSRNPSIFFVSITKTTAEPINPSMSLATTRQATRSTQEISSLDIAANRTRAKNDLTGCKGGSSIHDVKTAWMTYLGCFYGDLQTEMTNIKSETLKNNQPKTCSSVCGNEPNFALQKDHCLCFHDIIISKLKEPKENRCHEKCPQLTQNYFFCGSSDSYSVYRRDTGLNIEGKEDCLALSFDSFNSTIKAMSCDQKYQSICITKNGISITREEYNFFHAKLLCENNLGRLIIHNETMFPAVEQHTLYWIGTFRQSKVEQKTTVTTLTVGTTTSSLKLQTTTLTTSDEAEISSSTSSPEDMFTRFSSTEDMFTRTSSTEDMFTRTSALTNRTRSNSLSQSMIDDNTKSIDTSLQCGVMCFTLGICFCVVSILALTVCLFNIRQQWNIRLHKNEHGTNKSGTNMVGTEEEVDETERRPVYLDPVHVTAVFKPSNLSTINPNVYDEAGIYTKAGHSARQKAYVSGYQELNWNKPKDKLNNDDGQQEYDDPWNDSLSEASCHKGKRTKSNAQRQTEKKKSSLNFRSTTFRHQESLISEEPYTETHIDLKRFVYDQPQLETERKKKEPWVNYRYQQDECLKRGWAMTPGRGLSVAIKSAMNLSDNTKDTEKHPDIILCDKIASEVDSHIYETPEQNFPDEFPKCQGPDKEVKKRPRYGLRESIKLKLLEIPKSLRKYRRGTTADLDGVYEIPNPVKQANRSSKSRSIAVVRELDIPDQKGISNYELASPLFQSSNLKAVVNPNQRSSVSTSRIQQYEQAVPIGTNKDQQSSVAVSRKPHYDIAIPIGNVSDKKRSLVGSRALQYELAMSLGNKDKRAPTSEEDNTPIYFEPIA